MSKRKRKIGAWIIVGAIWFLFLAWLLSRCFPGDAGENLAAWLQAVGSMSAILAAFLVGRQTISQERDERRKSIVAVAGAAAEHARSIRVVLAQEDPGHAKMYNIYDKSIVDGMVHALTSAPAHEVGSSDGVIALLALRDQCVFLGITMKRYLDGPWQHLEFKREVESCGDNVEDQNTVIKGQKLVLAHNVRIHLDQIERHYTALKSAVEQD
jgi:hypothetical protein